MLQFKRVFFAPTPIDYELNRSNWPIDQTRKGITNPDKRKPGSHRNEGVLHTLQCSLASEFIFCTDCSIWPCAKHEYNAYIRLKKMGFVFNFIHTMKQVFILSQIILFGFSNNKHRSWILITTRHLHAWIYTYFSYMYISCVCPPACQPIYQNIGVLIWKTTWFIFMYSSRLSIFIIVYTRIYATFWYFNFKGLHHTWRYNLGVVLVNYLHTKFVSCQWREP